MTFTRSIILAAGISLASPVLPAGDAPRLNVLFIAVDDLNASLGCYGHPLVKTPNIDRLAARGVRFDRAYCQYPLCNPSRTSLLSGRRPETTRVFDNGTPPRTHVGDAVFLPEHFRRHGYFTARAGKIAHGSFEGTVAWEAVGGGGRVPGGDADGSTDRSDDGREAPESAPAEKKARPERQAQGGERTLKLQWRAAEGLDEDQPDGRMARAVARILEEHTARKDGRPFFVAAGFHKPHLPFVAPRKYLEMYPPDKVALPAEPADDRKDIPPAALTRTAGDEALTELEKRQLVAAYFACVSFLDAQVGILLDAIDRLGLAGNTVIVFFGDHGFHLGEHGGLWRKLTLFEESARVPLIAAAPGKRAGAASPRLVELVDLYPTLAELCGLPVPAGLEGSSFAPLLEASGQPWKKAAFSTVRRGRDLAGVSVHTERHRYTEWGGEESAELYDHDADPREYKNLARDPAHAEVLAEMRRLLRGGWRAALPGK